MGLLTGKNALIFGLANDKSIAWGIAQAFAREGAQLGFSYAGEALEKRVKPLASHLGVDFVEQCNVASDDQIANVADKAAKRFGQVDIIVHSIGFANKDELSGHFYNTSRAGFHLAMDISVYSFLGIMKAAQPLMAGRGGSALTLSYYGAMKVFPSYNVMGIAKAALEASVRYLSEAVGPEGTRVNAISAGPIRTLAAAGVNGFHNILNHVESKSPLRRTITQEDVANAALYLSSSMAGGVSGEIHYVDGGYNIIGL